MLMSRIQPPCGAPARNGPRRAIAGCIAAIAALAALPAAATILDNGITPITDETHCPGQSLGAPPIGLVLPYVPTPGEDFYRQKTLTFAFKDNSTTPNPPRTAVICGFDVDGTFIGGSKILYAGGSALWFSQYEGTLKVTLATLLQTKVEDLLQRRYQLYWATTGSPSIVEVTLETRYATAIMRPRGPAWPELNATHGGNDDRSYTIFHVSNALPPSAGAKRDRCSALLKVLHDDGVRVLAQHRFDVPNRGQTSVDLRKFVDGFSGAVTIGPDPFVDRASACSKLVATRETRHKLIDPSLANLALDTLQSFEPTEVRK